MTRWMWLNEDASWWAEVAPGGAVVFDPWLVGSEVDGWPWFHEAWHAGPVVAPEQVPEHVAVVVSQRYADHAHPATLARMPARPVLAVPDAAPGLRRALPDREVRVIPAYPEGVVVGGLRVSRLSTPWWRLPVYHAVVVRAAGADGRGVGPAVVHAPHGLGEAEARRLDVAVTVLATSRQRVELPWVLGGAVAPGAAAADGLVATWRPQVALVCHDAAKRSAGLVPRLSRVEGTPLDQAAEPSRWRAPTAEAVGAPQDLSTARAGTS